MWFNEILYLHHSLEDSNTKFYEEINSYSFSYSVFFFHTITDQHMVKVLFFGTDEHTYFYLLLGYPTTNFGLFLRDGLATPQPTLGCFWPHSPHFKCCVIQFRPEGQFEPRNEVRFLNRVKH